MFNYKVILGAVRAIWQLFSYVSIGLPIFILLLPSAPFMGNSKKILGVWIWFDRLVATIVHFTWKRTISGISGQYMTKYKRYLYQARVIDKLAEWCGDGKNHCIRAYKWEQKIGVVK